MIQYKKASFYALYLPILMICFGCKKLVEISPPISSITTSQTFSTDIEATQAMVGVYNYMINGSGTNAFNGAATVYCGAYADELNFFNTGDPTALQFQENSLLANNSEIGQFWMPVYKIIYDCNAVFSGVVSSSAIHDSVKNELIGEAELVRAFSYFYLTNWFGGVPLVTTIDYNKTSLLSKSFTDTIYASIIADLKDAELRLPTDYSVASGQRIVPNRWAASALLARIYLYRRGWQDAEAEATKVINNTSLYSLVSSVNDVFNANSTEAIWQLQQQNQQYPYNATPEGMLLVPSATSPPYVTISQPLLQAFEDSDQRKSYWIDSTDYFGSTYYFPYKYRIGPDQATPNGVDSSYYTVLRLAEQYLIRAEARAQIGDVVGSQADLNMVRHRAGLSNTTASDQPSLLAAVAHERQVELFAEWGHRWLDLKRWGIAQVVLDSTKGGKLSSNALLYPIPPSEIQTDPNLKQNPGY